MKESIVGENDEKDGRKEQEDGGEKDSEGLTDEKMDDAAGYHGREKASEEVTDEKWVMLLVMVLKVLGRTLIPSSHQVTFTWPLPRH